MTAIDTEPGRGDPRGIADTSVDLERIDRALATGDPDHWEFLCWLNRRADPLR